MTPINTMNAWRPLKRPLATLVICAHLAVALQPLSAIAQDKGAVPFNPNAQAQVQRAAHWSQRMQEAQLAEQRAKAAPADKASAELARLAELTRDLASDLQNRQVIPASAGASPAKGAEQSVRAIGPDVRIAVQQPAGSTLAVALSDADRAARWKELQGLLTGQQQAQTQTLQDMDRVRQALQGKQLDAEILRRHDEAVGTLKQWQARTSQVAEQLQAAASNPISAPGALQSARDLFEHMPGTRTPRAKDPSKLPWRAPEAAERLPAETQTSWYQNLYGHESHQLAQAGGSIGPLSFSTMPVASVAPTEADLAPTDEVQLTAAIRAKATELGNNPVHIHNWVHNTIEWAPTWGAIQSAQTTLDKKRGNAFDIASLQIALLRAANIPARYQLGTIEIGAEQLKNWVGGVNSAEAAQQIIAQGGIASRGLIEGGQVAKFRMEHVWVQAYVNWAPSRGAQAGSAGQHVNPNARQNAWVPLDAAYKQYQHTPGMDLAQAVPLDAQALLNAAQTGATVNEAQGWVQNLNQAAIQSQLTDYQNRLKAHIEASPGGADTTVGQVIGRQIIPQKSWELLAGTLAHPVIQRGAQMAALPQSLQHRFSFRLSEAGLYGEEGNNHLNYTAKLSQIEGKRLTLSYVPASQADADLIASYLPQPNADGSPIRPEQLPSSLPGYLIRLKPQLTLDGQVVASSSASLTMGTELSSTGGFTQLRNPNQWDLTQDDSHVAGQATAIGISAGGISAAQLERLKQRLETTRTTLQSADQAAIQTLSGEQISGDLLTATLWSWFAASESHNRLSQNQAQMVENPGLSYGLFHAVAEPVYSWGVVRKVEFPGVNLDIGHIRTIGWAKDNDRQKWIGYNRLRGQYMSALEHAIPERFFNDPASCNTEGSTTQTPGLPACPKGVSAVQAIGTAAQAGQKIYTITREVYNNNPNIVASALGAHSSSTRSAVQSALNAGLEVTIHERPVTISGWTGAGYTTIDPNTGAGGYIIEGGSNGGQLILDWIGANPGWAALAGIGLGLLSMMSGFIGIVAFILGLALALASLYVTFLQVSEYECGGVAMQALFLGLAAILTLLGIFFGGGVGGLIGLAAASYLWGELGGSLQSGLHRIPGACQ